MEQLSNTSWVPTIQFHSDAVYLELASHPTGKQLSPTKLLPSQTPTASPGVNCTSDQLAVH